MKDRVDPRKYNGAVLLGLNGIVVKSHGSTDPEGFSNAVKDGIQRNPQRRGQSIRFKEVNSKEMLPHILENVGTSNSKIYNRAIRFLKEWDHIENIDSKATLIFHSISNNIIKNIYYDELSLLGDKYFETFVGLKYITKRNLRRIMKNHNNKWVDDIRTPNKKETINDIISISIKNGIQDIVDNFGPNWSNWKWGYAHSLTHKHILGDINLLDYLFNLNIGPYLSGGSDVTPNAGGYSLLKGFNQTSGASMRRIVDFSDMNKTSMILPTGQSGLHNSPHYHDQAPLYHKGNYRESHFKKDYAYLKIGVQRHRDILN